MDEFKSNILFIQINEILQKFDFQNKSGTKKTQSDIQKLMCLYHIKNKNRACLAFILCHFDSLFCTGLILKVKFL